MRRLKLQTHGQQERRAQWLPVARAPDYRTLLTRHPPSTTPTAPTHPPPSAAPAAVGDGGGGGAGDGAHTPRLATPNPNTESTGQERG
ncbi:unnamed protein product [Closterium sp. NIES-64]|nr:unnamed protein product [Closterium sp. NIES-64]